MKKLLLLIPLLLLLSGCQRPVSLSQRAVVKMICISKEKENYHVKLIAYTAPQGEENADAEREVRIAEGEGDAVRTALLDAEEQMQLQAFYAQNELLLVEQQAAAWQLDEILAYFSQERASRPNTAVYAYQADEEKKLTDPETVEQTVRMLEDQKNGSGSRDGVDQMIYRFDLTGKVEDFFFLPRLVPDEEGAETDALLFFQNNQLRLTLTGEEMEMAQLLLGAADSYQYEDGRDSCTVEDLRFVYEAEDLPQPRLKVYLRGEVKDLRSEADPEELESRIEEELSMLFNQLYTRCCVENGLDPFRFGWWFLSLDAERFAPLIEKKTLLRENTLQLSVRITVAA